jgi:hypothetical protein
MPIALSMGQIHPSATDISTLTSRKVSQKRKKPYRLAAACSSGAASHYEHIHSGPRRAFAGGWL